MQRFDVSAGGAALGVNPLVEKLYGRSEAEGAEIPASTVDSVTGRNGSSRRRAIVIDRSRSSRAFIAEALNAFEPGFDVITASDTDVAAEWTVAFLPDLIVVDSDDTGAVAFVRDIASRRTSGLCRVIWIGRSPSPDGETRGPEGVVQHGVGLTELLRTIRTVWEG